MLEAMENKIGGNALNGLSLAFIGDCVFELLVREHVLKDGSMQVGKLHDLAVKMVKASAQAGFFDLLEPELCEDEHSAMYRGRNACATHIPKGANAIEYRKATGLEALFGWLYLEGKTERCRELFEIILENTEKGGEKVEE